MIKIKWVIIITVMILLVNSFAQDKVQSDVQLVKKEIIKLIIVDTKTIYSLDLRKVFKGIFYHVKLSRKDSIGGTVGMGKLMLVKVDDNFVFPETTNTGKTMPRLKSLLKKGLPLRNVKDAEVIQKALNAIYPVRSISEKKFIEIKPKGDEWIFIRGKFFKESKGFIFKTKEGSITEIRYSLGIKI